MTGASRARTALLCLLLTAVPAIARDLGEAQPAAPGAGASSSGGPGVVLVLSGGGARGAAHIGVLEVLEELHVPVDMVVGTSMGSVVGGLYAAGWTPESLVGIISAIDWVGVFSDAIPFRDKSFRRRQDDATFLVRGTIRFDHGRPYLPLGVFQGRRIELVLESLDMQTVSTDDFDQLPIPFRAVAADLDTSEAVVLDHGSLAMAQRASMSIPGVFAPVVLDGRTLVDGGVAANLPVGIALELGARRIIAVDISSHLSADFTGRNFLSVMQRLNAFLTASNVEHDAALLRPQDLLLRPELGDLTFADFTRMDEAIEIGRRCALAHADELRRFAVDDATWEAWWQAHRTVRSQSLRVARLEVRNSSGISDGIIRARFEHWVGTSLDLTRLNQEVMDLHGLELVGRVDVALEGDGEERVLAVEVDPLPFGPNSLRLGLGLRDDLQSQVAYSLTVRHRVLPLNRRGGEWVNLFEIGETQAVRTELYQPLDDRLAWFVAPGAEYRRDAWTLWDQGEPLYEIWIRSAGGRLDVGRTFGTWGELRMGAYWGRRTAQKRVGVPGLLELTNVDAGVHLSFGVQTFDAPVFPRSGTSARVQVGRSTTALGSDLDVTDASLTADHALTVGRFTLVPGVQAYRSWGDEPTLYTIETLGGLWRLSGYGERELAGQRTVLARVVSYAELFEAGLAALSTRLYAGASVEAGNAWLNDQHASPSDLLWSGSLFLGADTILGPIYLGWGIGDGGRDRWYLNIGASF